MGDAVEWWHQRRLREGRLQAIVFVSNTIGAWRAAAEHRIGAAYPSLVLGGQRAAAPSLLTGSVAKIAVTLARSA